jgi:hypothetical protein
MENKSLRGKLIETIIYFVSDSKIEEFKNILIQKLSSELSFNTNVFNIDITNNILFGKIHFIDENNNDKMIDFSIDYLSKVITTN